MWEPLHKQSANFLILSLVSSIFLLGYSLTEWRETFGGNKDILEQHNHDGEIYHVRF